MSLRLPLSARSPWFAVISAFAVAAQACAAPVDESAPESAGNAMKAADQEDDDLATCLGPRAKGFDERQSFRRRAEQQVVYVDVGPGSAAELVVPQGESLTIVPVGRPQSKARSLASASNKGPVTLGNAGIRTVRYRITLAPNDSWADKAGFVNVVCSAIEDGPGSAGSARRACTAGKACTTSAQTVGTCEAYGVDASDPTTDGVAIGSCR